MGKLSDSPCSACLCCATTLPPHPCSTATTVFHKASPSQDSVFGKWHHSSSSLPCWKPGSSLEPSHIYSFAILRPTPQMASLNLLSLPHLLCHCLHIHPSLWQLTCPLHRTYQCCLLMAVTIYPTRDCSLIFYHKAETLALLTWHLSTFPDHSPSLSCPPTQSPAFLFQQHKTVHQAFPRCLASTSNMDVSVLGRGPWVTGSLTDYMQQSVLRNAPGNSIRCEGS